MSIPTYTVVPANPWPIPTLGAHPRLFFTPTRLARFRALWAAPTPNFTALKAQIIADTNPMSLMVQYAATGDVTKLTTAYNAVVGQAYGTFRSANTLYADWSAFVFDWGYNDLTPAQRSAMVAQLDSFNAQREAEPTNGALAGCGQEQGYVGYTLGVLAIEGEAGATSRLSTLRNMLQNVTSWIDEAMADGHWVGYPHEVTNFIAGAFLPFHIAGSVENLAASRFKYAANRTKLLAYRTTSGGWNMLSGPSDHKAMGSGTNNPPTQDGTQDTAKAEMGFHYAMMADVLGDGLAQTMANAVSTQSASFKWTTGVDSQTANPTFLAMIFYNPANPSTAVSTLPPSAIFPLPGQAAFRTGWSNPATTVRGWLYGHVFLNLCHDNRYNGALEISRGDDQLICNQYTYAGQPSAWMSGTMGPGTVGDYSMCKSTLLFSPTGSATPDRSGSQTGVQPPNPAGAFPIATQLAGGAATWLAGTVGNFVSKVGYAQATADYGNAYYPNDKVTSAKRLVALLNGPDEAHGTFFVRDCFATLAGAVDRIRALWGCRQKPIGMTGETVVAGSTTAGVLTYPNQPVVIQWRNSQATIQMVSPAPVTLRLIGGIGYESYFDGANLDYWTNAQSGKTANQLARIASMWRLECETTPAASNGQMLFAITVGNIGETAPTYTSPQMLTMAPQLFGIQPFPDAGSFCGTITKG